MVSVHDVAAFILAERGPMSAMKLQKLVYFSQAWSLVQLREPLFGEQVQAWAHGPVVYELFDLHRGKYIVPAAWPAGDASRMSEPQRCLVQRVLRSYGAMSASQLSERTHAEAPWKDARRGLPEDFPASAVIGHESMMAFYSAQALPEP
jgi:uncharacterized phage-associated protein